MDYINSETGKPYNYRARVKPCRTTPATRKRARKALDSLWDRNAFGVVLDVGTDVYIYYDYFCADCGKVSTNTREDNLHPACEDARRATTDGRQ